MSFASEHGQDDGSLPPLNVEIPDDARELARDVLAYHREQRARRRRERVLRLLGPLGRAEVVRHGAVIPIVATCTAMAMLIVAMLSIMTVSPASAPTLDASPPAGSPDRLPAGQVQLDGHAVSIPTLTQDALVLVPSACGCGNAMKAVADQARSSRVSVYFVYYAPSAAAAARAAGTTRAYGDGVARTLDDQRGTLFDAYEPAGMTVLLVRQNASVEVYASLPARFNLTAAMRAL